MKALFYDGDEKIFMGVMGEALPIPMTDYYGTKLEVGDHVKVIGDNMARDTFVVHIKRDIYDYKDLDIPDEEYFIFGLHSTRRDDFITRDEIGLELSELFYKITNPDLKVMENELTNYNGPFREFAVREEIEEEHNLSNKWIVLVMNKHNLIKPGNEAIAETSINIYNVEDDSPIGQRILGK